MTRSRAKDKKATSPPKKAAKASPKKAAKASPVAKKAGKIAKAVEFVAKKIAPKKAPPAKKASPAKAKSPPKKPSKSPATKKPEPKTPEPKKAKPVASPVKAEMTPRASGRQRKVMDYSAMAKGTPQDPLKAASPATKRKSEVVQTAKTPVKRTKREESPKKEKPVVVKKAADSPKKAPAKAPTSPKKVPDSPKKTVAAKKVEQSPRKAPESPKKAVAEPKKKPEPKVQESPKKAAAASPKKAESKVVEVPAKVQPSPKKVPEGPPKNTAESKKKPEAKVIELPAKVVESPKKEPLTKVIEIPAKVIQSPKKGSTSPTRASMRSPSPKKVIEVTDEFITNDDASEQKIVSVEPMTQVIVIEKSDDSESHTDVIKVQLAPHEKIIQINNGIPIEAGNGIPIERCHDCPGCLRKPCNECSFCKNGQKLLCIDRYCMNTDEGRKQREDAKAKYLESLSKAKLDSEQLFEPDRNLTIQEQVDMIMNQLQFKQKSRPPSDVRARLISTPRTPKTPVKSPGDPKEKKVRAKHKMVAVYGSSERASKSRRCGECEGCMRDDCGTCAACRDKPRFGGKGSKKKACIARSCRMRGPPAQGQALVVAPTQGEGENTAYQIVVMKQDD